VTFLGGRQRDGQDDLGGQTGGWYRTKNRTVLLCAADTFRAAAIEQLEVWASRSGVEMIKTRHGGDPAAVLYDAASAAKARKIDELIVDTAGRLHTKAGLMDELDKMRRTAAKLIPGAPHEVLLVMDATTGQNGLQQARQFTQSAGATGIILTKLDGTAKGGIAVAIAQEMGLPVLFAGVGEQMNDLLEFSPAEFVDSLLG
jgi:fused signal recognition particle receptor